MNAVKKIGVRSLAAFLSLVMVATLAYAPIVEAPPRAHAQWVVEHGPIAHVISFLTKISTSITATNTGVSAVNATRQTISDTILKPLAWALAQAAIHSMTQSIVNWINSGFHGSPAFATDIKQNLRNLGDAAADMFLDQLKVQGGIDLRTPFQDQVANAVRDSYYKQGRMETSYNLNQLSSDPKGFINGQFGKGGFNAWFGTVLNSDNNPIGALYKAKNGLSNAVSEVRTNQLHELDWGHGFLSWRGSCAVKAPAPAAGAPATSLNSKDTCLTYNIETPGSIIENQLGITATSPLRQLELAQSINQIVAALAGQLVSHIMGGGGLRSASNPSSGGGGSPVYQATVSSDSAASSATLADGFLQAVNDERAQVVGFQSNWQTIKTAALTAQTACASSGSQPSTSDSTVTVSVRIQQILNSANDALSRAAASLTEIDSIKKNADAATDPNSTTQGTSIASITQQYERLTSSSTLPSAQEMDYASTQSQNSGSAPTTAEELQAAELLGPGAGGDSAPPLYTGLHDLATNGCSGSI